MPPGHDLTAARPTPSPATPEPVAAPRVLCVANWQPRKGIVALLEAVAGLPADTVTLHLVG